MVPSDVIILVISASDGNSIAKYLNNHWIFEAHTGEGGDAECLIDFYVDFEFKSRLFQAAIGAVFNKAVKRMIQAFEKRADELYGVE